MKRKYMKTYQIEKLSDCIDELKAFSFIHWNETEKHQVPFILDMAWSEYLLANEKGILQINTLRIDEKIEGYVLTMISTNPHYQHILAAEYDSFYLSPKYRGYARYLFSHTEKTLKDRGIQMIYASTKNIPRNSEFLQLLGYDAIEVKHLKVI